MKDVLVDKRMKLLIFPEGTICETGGFLPFKRGAFFTAIQAQVPIIPMVQAPYYYMDRKGGRILHQKSKTNGYSNDCQLSISFFPEHNILSVLDPIETTGMIEADVDILRDRVHAVMIKEYERLYDEIEAKKKDTAWLTQSKPRLTLVE